MGPTGTALYDYGTKIVKKKIMGLKMQFNLMEIWGTNAGLNIYRRFLTIFYVIIFSRDQKYNLISGLINVQGCIAVSMTVHKTSFCFVCSHLASGEKGGDELRRNSDVIEILKGTTFPRICKNPSRRIPERIIDHE